MVFYDLVDDLYGVVSNFDRTVQRRVDPSDPPVITLRCRLPPVVYPRSERVVRN